MRIQLRLRGLERCRTGRHTRRWPGLDRGGTVCRPRLRAMPHRTAIRRCLSLGLVLAGTAPGCDRQSRCDVWSDYTSGHSLNEVLATIDDGGFAAIVHTIDPTRGGVTTIYLRDPSEAPAFLRAAEELLACPNAPVYPDISRANIRHAPYTWRELRGWRAALEANAGEWGIAMVVPQVSGLDVYLRPGEDPDTVRDRIAPQGIPGAALTFRTTTPPQPVLIT